MGRRARLQEFLGKRYTDSKELRAFVDDTFGLDAVNSIGWEEGVNDETSDLIRWLESRGKVAELWPALKSAFPSFTDDIDALAREWKPSPIARFVPAALLHSRPVQVGVAAIACAFALGAWFLWFRTASYTAVIVLDAAARDAASKGKRFDIVVDGVVQPMLANGVSIGRGELLPSSLERAYRAEVPKASEFPTRISVRLTDKRAAKIRVRYQGRDCATQPQIIADGNSLRVVKLKDCDSFTANTAAMPRPKIGVAIKIIGSEGFKTQFQIALDKIGSRTTIEEFLTQQLIAQFSAIEMFEFVPWTEGIDAKRTLVGTIATSWPTSGGVTLRLRLGNEDDQPVELFSAVGCTSVAPCGPDSLTHPDWYKQAFQNLVQQWPEGFLKSVPLSRSAIYDEGGVVRTVEDLDHFDQAPGGPPRALFDIAYGNERQRTFVLCHAHPDEAHQAAGFDVTENLSAMCSDRVPQVNQPEGKDGIVTLKKLLRVVPR